MPAAEVKSRIDAINRYNAYFATELDSEGKPLTHHMVTSRALWTIMTREWGVDPKDFGITEPPPTKWNGGKDETKPATDLTDGL